MSVLDAVFLFNLFLLTNASSAAFNLGSSYYQGVAVITSVSFSIGLFMAIVVLHVQWKFGCVKSRKRTGANMHLSNVVQDSATQEINVSVNGANNRSESPPSQEYSSSRGVHQFDLVFDNQDTPSATGESLASYPVLREREPLLFDQ